MACSTAAVLGDALRQYGISTESGKEAFTRWSISIIGLYNCRVHINIRVYLKKP